MGREVSMARVRYIARQMVAGQWNETPMLSTVMALTLQRYLRILQAEGADLGDAIQQDARLRQMLEDELRALTEDKLAQIGDELQLTRRSTSTGESLLTWKSLPLPADRLVKASFAALVPGAIVPRDDHDQLVAAYEYTTPKTTKERARILIGYLADRSDKLAQVIEAQGALCTKVQLALWARWCRSGEKEKITYSIDDLLDDVGYKKKKRAHKTENRLAVGRALAALFDLEVDVEFDFQGRSANSTGPLWERGFSLDLRDNGKRVRGVIRYAPGEWFTASPAWRARNAQIAQVAPGILRLSNQERHRAAVFLGGYFATLARMNGNEHVTLTGDTLAKMAGLKEKKPGRLGESIERTLDQLVEVGVIKAWANLSDGDPVEDPDDLDNPDTLAGLADDGLPDNFRKRRIVITWPDMIADTAPEIAAKQQQHIKEAKKRKARREAAAVAAKSRRETA